MELKDVLEHAALGYFWQGQAFAERGATHDLQLSREREHILRTHLAELEQPPMIGDRDAAFWRAEYQRVCKERDDWKAKYETTQSFLAECTEQRDVAWKRIDQLTAELAALKQGMSQLTHEVLPDGRKKLVGQWMDAPVTPAPSQVDHLAEAKRILANAAGNGIATGQLHILIALTEYVKRIAEKGE